MELADERTLYPLEIFVAYIGPLEHSVIESHPTKLLQSTFRYCWNWVGRVWGTFLSSWHIMPWVIFATEKVTISRRSFLLLGGKTFLVATARNCNWLLRNGSCRERLRNTSTQNDYYGSWRTSQTISPLRSIPRIRICLLWTVADFTKPIRKEL